MCQSASLPGLGADGFATALTAGVPIGAFVLTGIETVRNINDWKNDKSRLIKSSHLLEVLRDHSDRGAASKRKTY